MSAKCRSAWYRVYFLSPNGDIRNVDEFVANDDRLALMLADGLHEAVSDIYAGYELWQGSRRIYRFSHPAARPFVQQVITQRMQAEMLRRLEVLQSSGTAFGRSRHLVERMKELQDALGPSRRRKRFG